MREHLLKEVTYIQSHQNYVSNFVNVKKSAYMEKIRRKDLILQSRILRDYTLNNIKGKIKKKKKLKIREFKVKIYETY